jgi:hypothetical protein
MRINRTYALAGSAWLVLVVVGAVLVWAVISRVGEGVITQPGSTIGEAAPITSPPESERTDRPKSPRPSKPRSSKSASASPRGPSTSGPSGPRSSSGTPNSSPEPPAPTSSGAGPGPGPSPGPRPPSSPNNPPPSSSSPSPKPTQDQGVRRTWQGSAGVVTVECRGQSISLQGAQPNSGWSIEVDERGPAEVQVDFDSNNSDRRTRVQSECVGGTPRFDVDREDD